MQGFAVKIIRTLFGNDFFDKLASFNLIAKKVAFGSRVSDPLYKSFLALGPGPFFDRKSYHILNHAPYFSGFSLQEKSRQVIIFSLAFFFKGKTAFHV